MTRTQIHAKDHVDHATEKDLFRAVAGHWASGVAVITTADRMGNPFGLTMCAVTALSLRPIQFLICVDDNSNSLPPLLDSRRFCINYLSSGQEDVAMRFATKSGLKFEGLPHCHLQSGSFLLHDVLAYADCKVSAIHDGGDHRIIVGEVIDMAVFGGEPLTYFAGKFRTLAQARPKTESA